MGRILLSIIAVMFLSAGILLTAGTTNAVAGHIPMDFGFGTGCSAIENVSATSLVNGDTFQGVINRVAIVGSNHKGRGSADNSDADPFSTSLGVCINDALHGFCSDVFDDDSSCYVLTDDGVFGNGRNRRLFTIEFTDVNACCGTSQCSDHIDNDTDNETDFGGAHGDPPDTDCVDYRDNDESS